MKAILLLGLIALTTLTGCPPRQSGSNGGNPTTDNDPQAEAIAVSGQVFRTSDYCGGAAPDQEMLDELATPRPFAGMNVHVRPGNTNQLNQKVQASAITDAEGRFKLMLPPGTWCLVLDEKGPDAPRELSSEYVQVDEDCYKEWLKRCDEVVELKPGAAQELRITFHQRCHLTTLSNCATWVGPLPPSPPPMDNK